MTESMAQCLPRQVACLKPGMSCKHGPRCASAVDKTCHRSHFLPSAMEGLSIISFVVSHLFVASHAAHSDVWVLSCGIAFMMVCSTAKKHVQCRNESASPEIARSLF
jgi:hypothetical protein